MHAIYKMFLWQNEYRITKMVLVLTVNGVLVTGTVQLSVNKKTTYSPVTDVRSNRSFKYHTSSWTFCYKGPFT